VIPQWELVSGPFARVYETPSELQKSSWHDPEPRLRRRSSRAEPSATACGSCGDDKHLYPSVSPQRQCNSCIGWRRAVSKIGRRPRTDCCGALGFEVIEKSLGFEFVEEFSSPLWTELGRIDPPARASLKRNGFSNTSMRTASSAPLPSDGRLTSSENGTSLSPRRMARQDS